MLNNKFKNLIVDDLIKYSEVINQPTNKEVVLLHVKEMKYEWVEYALFEDSNTIQGRELVIPLPTANFNCLMQLKELCDTLSSFAVGPNRDYEYVIRWNKARAVFHLLYSERMINYVRTPKIYTRDFWYDSVTNRQSKPGAKNAVLRYEEGTFQRDKDGNLKYEEPLFLERDDFFLSEEWENDLNKEIEKLFIEFLAEKERALELPSNIDIQDEVAPEESPKRSFLPDLKRHREKPVASQTKYLGQSGHEDSSYQKESSVSTKLKKSPTKKFEMPKMNSRVKNLFLGIGGFFKKIGLRIGFVFSVIGSSIKRFFEKTGLLKKLSDFIN